MSATTPCRIINVPGPAGPAGAAGANGTNGINAYSLLTVPFTMPAELANATIVLSSTAWLAPGQIVYLQNGGWLSVQTITDGVTATVKNLKDTASGVYLGNVAPGTVLPVSSVLSPSGPQGPSGSSGTSGAPSTATYLTRQAEAGLSAEFNLGALASGLLKQTVAAGVSTPAIAADGADYLSPATGLIPADIGSSIQAYNALLAAVAGLAPTVADRLIYTTGVNTVTVATLTAYARTILAAASAATARALLNVLPGYGILGSITGWNLNSATTDTAFTIGSARYIIDKVTIDNATVNLNTATGGLFTAAGGAGTTIAADQALAALTASTKFKNLVLQAIAGTDVFTVGTLYARVGSAQGVAATANLNLFGWKLD